MKQVQALRLRRAIPPLLPATGLEVLGRYSLPSSITLRFLLELPTLNSLGVFRTQINFGNPNPLHYGSQIIFSKHLILTSIDSTATPPTKSRSKAS